MEAEDSNHEIMESVWSGYPRKVVKMPPKSLLLTIAGFFGVLFVLLLVPFYLEIDMTSLRSSVLSVEVKKCFVKVSNHLSCVPSIAKGKMELSEDGVLEIDGTGSNQCEVQLCVLERGMNDLQFFAATSTLVFYKLELLGALRVSSAIRTNFDLEAPVRVLFEDVAAPTISINLEQGVVTLGNVYASSQNLVIAAAANNYSDTTLTTPTLNINVIYGAVDMFPPMDAIASPFATAAGGGLLVLEAEVDREFYCIPNSTVNALTESCSGATTRCTYSLPVALPSTAANATAATYTAFPLVQVNATSFHFKYPTTNGTNESYVAGPAMENAEPQLSPEVRTILANTGNWSAGSDLPDFVQTIEIMTPKIGLVYLHAKRQIILELAPEWLTFMTGFALKPTYRRFLSVLSHYECTVPQSPRIAAEVQRSGSNLYVPRSPELARQSLYDTISRRDIFDIQQRILNISEIGVVAFETPERAILQPRHLQQAKMKLGGNIVVTTVKMGGIAIALVSLSWSMAFFLSLMTCMLINKHRGTLIRLVLLHRYRYLVRSISGYSDKCAYFAYFSVVTMFSWLTFHVSRQFSRTLTNAAGGYVMEFLRIHYVSSSGVASEDIPVMAKHELEAQYARWMGMQLQDPTSEDDFRVEVSRFGGGFAMEMLEVVPNLRRKKVSGQQAFDFSYEGMFTQYERSENPNDEILVSEVLQLAVKSDCSVTIEVVRKKLRQWQMRIASREVEVLTGLMMKPGSPFQDQKMLHDGGQILESYCASAPLYAPIIRMCGHNKPKVILNLIFETAFGGFSAFFLVAICYFIVAPLETEHALYSVDTRVLTFNEKGQMLNELLYPNPRNLLSVIIQWMIWVYIFCVGFEPLLVLATFSKLMVKSDGKFHPVVLLVLLRSFVSFWLVAMVAFFFAFITTYCFNVLCWWVLGVIISPPRMMVYAASAIAIVGTVMKTVQKLKDLRTYAIRHVKEEILKKTMEVVRKVPIAGADQEKAETITGGMLLDVASGDEQGLQDLSSALGVPLSAIAMGLAAIRRTASSVDTALASVVKELGFPEQFIPIITQLVYHEVGLPVNPTALLHGLYQLAPDQTLAKKVKKFDPVLIPILTCMLTNKATDDDVVYALLQVLTGQLSILTKIKQDIMHRIFEAGLQMYMKNNTTSAAQNLASVMGELMHEVPAKPPILPKLATAVHQAALFAGERPNRFLETVIDLFLADADISGSFLFQTFSKLLVETEAKAKAASSQSMELSVSFGATNTDASGASTQSNWKKQDDGEPSAEARAQCAVQARAFLEMAAAQLQSRLSLHPDQLRKLRAMYQMLRFDTACVHLVITDDALDVERIFDEAYSYFEKRPWRGSSLHVHENGEAESEEMVSPTKSGGGNKYSLFMEGGGSFFQFLLDGIEAGAIHPLSGWMAVQWSRIERMILAPPGLHFAADSDVTHRIAQHVAEEVMLPPPSLTVIAQFGEAFDTFIEQLPKAGKDMLMGGRDASALRSQLLELGLSGHGVHIEGSFFEYLEARSTRVKRAALLFGSMRPTGIGISLRNEKIDWHALVVKAIEFSMHPLGSLSSNQENERRRTYRELGYYLIEVLFHNGRDDGVDRTALIDDSIDSLLALQGCSFEATTHALHVSKHAVKAVANPIEALNAVSGIPEMMVILPIFVGDLSGLEKKIEMSAAMRLFGVEEFRVNEARGRLRFFSAPGNPFPIPITLLKDEGVKKVAAHLEHLRDLYLNGRLSKTRDCRSLTLSYDLQREPQKHRPIDEDEMMEIVVHFGDARNAIRFLKKHSESGSVGNMRNKITELRATFVGVIAVACPFLNARLERVLAERQKIAALENNAESELTTDGLDENAEKIEIIAEDLDATLALPMIKDFVADDWTTPSKREAVFEQCSPLAMFMLDVRETASSDHPNPYEESPEHGDAMVLMSLLSGYFPWASVSSQSSIFFTRFPIPFKALCCAAAQKQKTRQVAIQTIVNTFAVRHRLIVADFISLACGSPQSLFGLAGMLDLTVEELRVVAAIAHPDTRWCRKVDSSKLSFDPRAFAVVKDIIQTNYYRLLATKDLHVAPIIEAVMAAIIKRDPTNGHARVKMLHKCFPSCTIPSVVADIQIQHTPLLKILDRLSPSLAHMIRQINDLQARRNINLGLAGLFILRGSYDEAAACVGKWAEMNSVNFALGRLILMAVRLVVEEGKVSNPPDMLRCGISMVQLIKLLVINKAPSAEVPRKVRLLFDTVCEKNTLRLIEMALSEADVKTHIPVPPLVAPKGTTTPEELSPKEIRTALTNIVSAMIEILSPDGVPDSELLSVLENVREIIDSFFVVLQEPSFEALMHAALTITKVVKKAMDEKTAAGIRGLVRSPLDEELQSTSSLLMDKLLRSFSELATSANVSVSVVVFVVVQTVVSTYADPKVEHLVSADSLLHKLTPAHLRNLRVLLEVANGNFTAFPDLVSAMGLNIPEKNFGYLRRLFNIAKTVRSQGSKKEGGVNTDDVIEMITAQLFGEFDQDGDGAIDVQEFEGVLARLSFHVHRHESALLFSTADKDGSGSIDLHEFHYIIEVFQQRFHRKVMDLLGLTQENIIVAVAGATLFIMAFCSFILLGVNAFFDGGLVAAATTGALPLLMTVATSAQNPNALLFLQEKIEAIVTVVFDVMQSQ